MSTTTKVFCLLSGGLDSSTTVGLARHEFPDSEIECVTIDYGQRHIKERESAAFIAEHFGADHITINIAGLLTGMLVDKGADNEAIPDKSYAELEPGISPTYVSFRNGMMLSILAARAQGWVMAQEAERDKGKTFDANSPKPLEDFEAVLYCGVHADDGANWAYPDCTPEFIGPMQAAILVGTYNKVRLRAPLQYLDKAGVVAVGLKAKVPLEHTWSCYKGEELQCGTCPTCRSRKEAFEKLGLKDPTQYADSFDAKADSEARDAE